jgi:predicted Zn-dependent protease
MKLRRKTSRRLVFLGVCTLGVLGLGAGVLGMRQAQVERMTRNFRSDGLALARAGEHAKALDPLSRYLKRVQVDREALLAYAECREHVEEPSGAHVTQAIAVYEKVLALDQGDSAASRRLLALYEASGRLRDARELAERLRPRDLAACGPQHVEVLRADASARLGVDKRDGSAEPLLRRLLELAPEDLQARILLVDFLRDQGRSGDALEVARGVVAPEPDIAEARRRLLKALASDDDDPRTTELITQALCDLAGLDLASGRVLRDTPMESPLEALRFAALFDRLGLHGHALATLHAGMKQHQDAALARLVARRSWMTLPPAQMLADFQDSPLASHAEVQAFRALAMIDASDFEGAQRVRQALEARTGDYRARAWARALPVIIEPPSDPGDAWTTLTHALQDAPGEPVLLVFLGDALERLGRTSEARTCWEQASESRLGVGWAAPWLRRAELALRMDQPVAAEQAAKRAAEVAPRSLAASVALLRTRVALIEAGYEQSVDALALLTQVERPHAVEKDLEPAAQRFREATLPAYATLLGTVRPREESAARVRASLARLRTPPSPETLEALFDASRRHGLGLEDELLAAWFRQQPDSDRLALARALREHDKGDPLAGRAILEGRAPNRVGEPAEQEPPLARRIALARYLEATGDPGAREAWARLADAYPGNLDAQMRALLSPAVGHDVVLVNRLLDRARELGRFTPETMPPALALAKARALLSEPVTSPNRAQAIDLLRGLTRREPALVEARSLFAEALAMDRPESGILPQRDEAVQQLQALASISPSPASAWMRAAAILREKGDATGERTELDRVAKDPAASLSVRLSACAALSELGEHDLALRVLDELASTRASEPRARSQVTISRAGVLRRMGRDAEALTLLRSTDVATSADARAILDASLVFAMLGDVDAGRAALSHLDALSLKPGEATLARARFASEFEGRTRTLALLREATTQAPTSAEAWLVLAAYLCERDDVAGAREALRDARAKLPDDARLAVLDQQLSAAGSGVPGASNLEALARVLHENPRTRLRAQSVRSLDRARANAMLASDEQVEALREQFRGDPALQALLARVLMQEQPPRLAQALAVLRATARTHPTSIEVASAGVEAFGRAGAWEDMKGAALAWQRLSREREAAAALAEACLRLGDVPGAIASLKPHLSLAQRTPEDPASVQVLALQAQALTRGGDASGARQLLAPALAPSADVRRGAWLALAGSAITPLQDAEAWIAQVEPMLNTRVEDDRLALAQAKVRIAERFGEPANAHARDAIALLQSHREATEASPAALLALAAAHAALADAARAADAITKASALAPSSPAPHRALAALLLDDDPPRSADAARRALAAAGGLDGAAQSLLAQALARMARALPGDVPGAERAQAWKRALDASEVAAALAPREAAPMLAVIDALEGLGRVDDTLAWHERLLALRDLPIGVDRSALLNNQGDAMLRAATPAQGSAPSALRRAQLERAREVVREAIMLRQAAPYFETLAGVQLALGDVPGAIDAGRRAIVADPKYLAGAVGLVRALAQGNEAQRREAGELARALLAQRTQEVEALSDAVRAELNAAATPR